ncbi:MAG: FmdE family protein, partial [Bacteroidales bacterium]
ILHETEVEEMPVDLVALGSLDNVAAAIGRLPDATDNIRTIYWAGGEIRAGEFPPETILKHTSIRLEMVRTEMEVRLDRNSFQKGLEEIGSRYADAVAAQLLQAPSTGAALEGSFRLREEVVPLYMIHPDQFGEHGLNDSDQFLEALLHSDAPVISTMLEMLDGEHEDKSIVFKHFPTDTAMFESDVAAIAPEILERHGEKEWKIVVMTNEFHEHLGIYSIVGAKMGLRAREYFNVGLDELTIVSCAGLSPPLSCMNDGLQASTGATLGHGTIEVDREKLFPGAIFRFKDRQLELSVKEEVKTQIREQVKYGVDTYGLESPEYWEYIRSLALKYWLDYSRFEIFDITGFF